MTRVKTKRTYKKIRLNKKSRRNTKKRGGKIWVQPPRQSPIPLPEVPTLAPPLAISEILEYNTGKIPQTKKRRQKGGFKADEVDILEDRDDDWMITKQ